MSDIKTEMDQVINELKSKGIDPNLNPQEIKGLGDIVESTLTKFVLLVITTFAIIVGL